MSFTKLSLRCWSIGFVPFLMKLLPPPPPKQFHPNKKNVCGIDWDFLKQTLKLFGLSCLITSLNMRGILYTSVSLFYSGSRMRSFIPICGLCQEDPLSLYLFVLSMERSRAMISREVQERRWVAL
ncbi:hypothetical protein CR513_24964, partial [Mucuna pruriens]